MCAQKSEKLVQREKSPIKLNALDVFLKVNGTMRSHSAAAKLVQTISQSQGGVKPVRRDSKKLAEELSSTSHFIIKLKLQERETRHLCYKAISR